MNNRLQSYLLAAGPIGSKSCIAALSMIVLIPAAQPLRADITAYDFFVNTSYSQTSGAAPTNPVGYFADFDVFLNNQSDFSSVTVTYPGPASPQPLSPNLPFSNFAYGSPLSSDLSGYPFGTYVYQASGGTVGSQTVSLNYTSNAFTSDIPALDASTYNALQGLNTALPFTFNFNSFTPNGLATYGNTYLTVYNSSFATGALSPFATSATMAANTLLPGTTYDYELDFSDRITGNDGGIPYTIGFDMRTDGSFTTATPEPGYFALLGAGMIVLLATVSRRRRASLSWSKA